MERLEDYIRLNNDINEFEYVMETTGITAITEVLCNVEGYSYDYTITSGICAFNIYFPKQNSLKENKHFYIKYRTPITRGMERKNFYTVSGDFESNITTKQNAIYVNGEENDGITGFNGSLFKQENIVVSSDSDWLNIVYVDYGDTNYDVECEIKYQCSSNTGATRNGKININATDVFGNKVNSYINIYQSQLNATANIVPDTNYMTITNEEVERNIQLQLTNIVQSGLTVVSKPQWISTIITSEENNISNLNLRFSQNTTSGDRIGTIKIQGTEIGTSETVITYITVKQRVGSTTVNSSPIWKDIDVEITKDATDGDYRQYRIVVDGVTVFHGNAYFVDGKASVRISDIVRDYITYTFTPKTVMLVPQIENNGGVIEARLETTTDGWSTYTTIYAVKIYSDWSYKTTLTVNNRVMSDPIFDFIDSRQKFLYTVIGKENNELSIFLTK